MPVRLRDLIIVLFNLFLIAQGKAFCTGKMFGFPCCTKTVSNPEYDAHGYPYGTENGKSCIVPKTCTDCVQGFCHGRMYGFPCCTERITNPDYDAEGNAFGKQGDASCIIPKGCTKCIITKTLSAISTSKTKSTATATSDIHYDEKGFCTGKMFGFPCCTKTVSNPEYDAHGYPYGTENGKSCIVPKTCTDCVQGFCHGRMYGFPCCTERITNPDYDAEGNAFGKQGKDSCIIPKGCAKCVVYTNATSTETGRA